MTNLKKSEKIDYLVNPDLIISLKKWYGELEKARKYSDFVAKGVLVLNTIEDANQLVKNIKNLTKRDGIALELFNSKLIKNIGPILKNRKVKLLKRPSAIKKQDYFFEYDNLHRLYSVTAKLYALDMKKWRIAYVNLNKIFNSLQEMQDHLKIMKSWKETREVIERTGSLFYSEEMMAARLHLQGSAILDFLYSTDCDFYLDKLFPSRPGGLYNIESIVDSNNVNLMTGGESEEAILAALASGERFGNRNSVINRTVCPGEEICLRGNFIHDSRPPNIYVCVPTYEGYAFATIVEWNQTEIKIIVPPDAKRGCIFLYDYGAYIDYVKCLERNNIYISSTFIPVFPPLELVEGVETAFTPPSCDNFSGPLEPVIEYIKINGKESYYQPEQISVGGIIPPYWALPFVWNGEEVEISFRVTFAENVLPHSKGIILSIFKPNGSLILTQELDPGPHPATNDYVYRFTPQLERATELTVEIKATNACFVKNFAHKYVSSTAKMIVQLKPNVKIVGVEVTQGIQKFELPLPNLSDSANAARMASNNSVTLIRERTAVFRVYVDTGLKRDLDTNITVDIRNASHPREAWQSPIIQHVDEVRITGNLDYGALSYYINPENHIDFKARNPEFIDRDIMNHSLNFQIPGYFLYGVGPEYFVVKVFSPDRPDEECFKDTFHLYFNTVSVWNRNIDLCVVLYDNAHKGHEKTVNHDGRTDDEIRWDAVDVLTRYLPVTDNGINLYLPSQADQHKSTRRDLVRNDKEGWYRLGGDLEDLAEGYEDWTRLIWLGLVPTSSNYRLRGVGWPRNLCRHPHAVAQAAPCHTIPHEIGHTLGMDHTNCRDPGTDDLGDLSLVDELPYGRTQNTGVDVYSLSAKRRGSGDLMSYCSPHWTSAPTWKYLRNAMDRGA